MTSNNYKLSDEDRELFREAVSKISDIHYSKATDLIKFVATQTYLSDPIDCTINGDSILSYGQSQVASNQFLQLKRGELPIDACLDLHGMNLDEAKNRLIDFIELHTLQQHRVLLIIHGKGRDLKRAILKNAVNHWLPQIDSVLAFVSAVPKFGGTGALVVLLRRER